MVVDLRIDDVNEAQDGEHLELANDEKFTAKVW